MRTVKHKQGPWRELLSLWYILYTVLYILSVTSTSFNSITTSAPSNTSLRFFHLLFHLPLFTNTCRSFSRQGFVHSKLRNRLSDESVQMQMFFSFNTRALEQPNRHNGASCQELDDGEVNKMTAMLAGWYADDEIVAAQSEEEKVEERKEVGPEAAVPQLEVESDAEEEEVEVKSGVEDTVVLQVEERAEKSSEERLGEFVEKYVADNTIVRGWKWNSWKKQVLQTALLQEGIKTTEKDVIKSINEFIGERSRAD
jgi:hypothetical protein